MFGGQPPCFNSSTQALVTVTNPAFAQPDQVFLKQRAIDADRREVHFLGHLLPIKKGRMVFWSAALFSCLRMCEDVPHVQSPARFCFSVGLRAGAIGR